MKLLTVFTPTYNRAYTLPQLYTSLKNQTNKDFIWLIIDDGSTDNTNELIAKWKKENNVQIVYIYQENQGMHGAHNTAYANINTELNVCIDSDDYMPNDAVEKILTFWNEKGNKNIAGIVGLDADKKGDIIGTKIPEKVKKTTLTALYYKYRVKGDKKLVLRTEIVKQYPKYPIFADERFVPLDILYFNIEQDYKLLCINEVLCIVEYLEDGSTQNIFKQYLRHPKGFRYVRKERMMRSPFWKDRIKNNIHFVAKCIYLKKSIYNDNPKKITTTFLFPFGLMLYFYINFKVSK